MYDASHIIPASCGNDDLVLPQPIVCQPCNRALTKAEQIFANEPTFCVKATFLGVQNTRTNRDFSNDIFGIGPVRAVPGQAFRIDLSEDLHGADRLKYHAGIYVDDRLASGGSAEILLTPRWLTLYSRAVHKIAFEWYAKLYYVDGKTVPIPVDSSAFDALREFVRRGPSNQQARPILRCNFGFSDAKSLRVDVVTNPRSTTPTLLATIDLLGIAYAVVLSDDVPTAERILRSVAPRLPGRSYLLGNGLEVLGPSSVTLSGTWPPHS